MRVKIVVVVALLIWALAPHAAAAGQVSLENRTVLTLTVVKDGAALGEVLAGGVLVLPFDAGEVTLTLNRASGAPYVTRTLSVPEVGGPLWQILPTEGAIEVHNRSTRAVTIFVDGQPLADVSSNADARIEGVRPGQRALRAEGDGVLMAATSAPVEANGTYVWWLSQSNHEAGVNILRVANFSGERVDVYVDGKLRVGVYPGDSAAMVGIPEGQVAVEARSAAHKQVSATTLTFGSSTTHRWVVTGPDGGRAVLEVVNSSGARLKVCVDGAYCLRVDDKARVQYDSLSPGQHVFEAKTLEGDTPVQTQKVDLGVGVPYRWVVEAPTR